MTAGVVPVYPLCVAASLAAGVSSPAISVLPAMTSYAAEIAAASAADWFRNLIVYHSPVSAPSAPNPIKPGTAMATTIALAPHVSWEQRAIALNREPTQSCA